LEARSAGPDPILAGPAGLKPVYPGGTTMAGNASQLSDGAGAVVMMDADTAARRGLPILELFRGMQLADVAPEEMSIAIASAIRKLVTHHQLTMSDIDLWELHEAYAVTTLYNQAELETPWEITNVNGGAMPLGHPYGMSGIPIPRIYAARTRAAPPSPRDRCRVHGRR
jgi:acetyl-CoA C-acetyltransferase